MVGFYLLLKLKLLAYSQQVLFMARFAAGTNLQLR